MPALSWLGSLCCGLATGLNPQVAITAVSLYAGVQYKQSAKDNL